MHHALLVALAVTGQDAPIFNEPGRILTALQPAQVVRLWVANGGEQGRPAERTGAARIDFSLRIGQVPVTVQADGCGPGDAELAHCEQFELDGGDVQVELDLRKGATVAMIDTRSGQIYRCGQESAGHLDRLIEGQPVTCEPQGPRNRDGWTVAICSVRVQCEVDDGCDTFDRDLGAWMVADGWALDYERYSDSEHSEQQWDAEQAKKGLWAGEFERPWE